MNAGNASIRLRDRFGKAFATRHDSQDSPAGRHELMVSKCRSGMQDANSAGPLSLFDPGNRLA
jgi:hypothetical protein